MRILGIDPGTVSFDLCLLEDEEVKFEDSLPSTMVAENPEAMAEKCQSLKPDALIAPSGYGLPNRKLSEVNEREMFELTLVREGEEVPVLEGMKKFFTIIEQAGLETLFIPSVILLSSVPRWRKFNKIDMGTADKMCVAALSVEMVSRKKGLPYSEINHIVAELGGGYNCVMTIEKGKIINGIGGTLFPGPSFMNAGGMDGEVAYLLGNFAKSLLFEGGACCLTGSGNLSLKNFTSELYPEGFNAFVEGVLFAIASQKALSQSQEVYLSGRLTGYENIYAPIKARLEELGYAVSPVPLLSNKSKAAAQGYAMVGNGLYGGCFEPLVKHMGIDRAEGSVTDYVYWKERM
ncbi:MAG: DUF1464 family protein [Dehalococcoidales bacterium]|nr:DUF1464 family protein [Dehalococcoidales bacterium]